MYTVALTPMLVGSASAYYDGGSVSTSALCRLVLSAMMIIGWLNLTNDAFDASTSIDTRKRESVVNLLGGTQSTVTRVLLGAHALLIAAFLILFTLPRATLTLLAIAVVLGYTYQGPPFRLGYVGLGEPICYAAWTISVSAAYHAHRNVSPLDALQALAPAASKSLPAAAFLVATPTSLILLCSHFHQLKDDAAAGKRSPVVRLGTRRAATLVQFFVLSFFVSHPALATAQQLPYLCAVAPPLVAAPLAIALVRHVRANHAHPEQIRTLKYFAVTMHFFHGLTLAASFAVVTYFR